ncbi:unnamed protein product [Cuscuta campestris]|uniref:protein disulfide-isomerase n=1 Tax=Cuscuta campestris TaxID=132261 RepID=A0A484KKS1_9ASTE|nr:unnamed protein product [Cuscuta campestris]
MASPKSIAVLSVLVLFLISSRTASCAESKNRAAANEEEEDLSFLEEDGDSDFSHSDPYGQHHDFENYDDLEEDPEALGHGYDDDGSYEPPEVDEKDVAVLKEGNFSEFIAKNKYVMVEFYAPWCGHCQALTPEYAAAATELKGEEVALAKVDATEEAELAQKYEVQGFPTVYLFVDGVHKPYNGQRTKEAIVAWIKKKTGSALFNITTIEDAEHILATEPKLVLGFLDSLVGSYSDELASAAKLEDDVIFYQTSNSDVAKLFHLDPEVKRPALVMIKTEAEKINLFDGVFTKSAISEFVYENKVPLVNYFTRETAPQIFENPIKKQSFGEKFLEDNLKPFYKSEPIPENNDGDVKIVVGNNFDEIVLDESKDVLLEIYAPWCGHCQSLEPVYNKLAKHLKGIDSLVIAKMDGTTNEHPRAKSDGFPTLLFFPAGNKSFEPLTVDTDRTVVAFYKFLKKNASIPFKIQKAVLPKKPEAETPPPPPPPPPPVHETTTAYGDVKDEL